MNLPKSPITLLVESIKASWRMRGVEVLFSPRALPLGSAPARIVLVPVTEEHVDPENNDNWLDAVIHLQAHCWGSSFDEVRFLRGAFLQCLFDFQFTQNLLKLRFIGAEYSGDEDTAVQGWALVLNFSIRDTVDKVPLPPDSGSALVVNEQFAPDGVTTQGPTLTLP